MKFSELIGQDLEGLICHEEECGLYNAKRDTCYKLKRSLVIIEVLELRDIFYSFVCCPYLFSDILIYHYFSSLSSFRIFTGRILIFFFSVYVTCCELQQIQVYMHVE